jgi:hypothetical protein
MIRSLKRNLTSEHGGYSANFRIMKEQCKSECVLKYEIKSDFTSQKLQGATTLAIISAAYSIAKHNEPF